MNVNIYNIHFELRMKDQKKKIHQQLKICFIYLNSLNVSFAYYFALFTTIFVNSKRKGINFPMLMMYLFSE